MFTETFVIDPVFIDNAKDKNPGKVVVDLPIEPVTLTCADSSKAVNPSSVITSPTCSSDSDVLILLTGPITDDSGSEVDEPNFVIKTASTTFEIFP